MTTGRPWQALYDAGQPYELRVEHPDMLSAFSATLANNPEAPAILYFDAVLSFAELDRRSDAFAAALAARGLGAGDRLALMLQNVPHFVICLLAGWKLGAIVVPINPMNRERELTLLFNDCEPAVLVVEDQIYEGVVRNLDSGSCKMPPHVITASPRAFQRRDDARVLQSRAITRTGSVEDIDDAIAMTAGAAVTPAAIDPHASALIVYTSGTTGVPKGAIITHYAIAYNAQAFRDWIGVDATTPILGVAPLFHITGMVGHVALALYAGAPLILAYRFDSDVVLDAIIEHRPIVTVCAVTVLIALLNNPRADRAALSSLTHILSGGAPVPPAVIDQFRDRFGHSIRTAYGLTETAAPTHMTPMSRETPVRDDTLSIGVPIQGVDCWVADDEDRRAPPGTPGEIVLSGPQVSPGYWGKPEETAVAMRPDGFRTGDIGVMDAEGWCYLIDRKKDMIISSGYKVWPREVEDVLYSHPAVREAAVVAAADAYRGETVRAVVSLKVGFSVESDELKEFCKARMAAYKYPRIVDILDELPKTPSGKILRRELR